MMFAAAMPVVTAAAVTRTVRREGLAGRVDDGTAAVGPAAGRTRPAVRAAGRSAPAGGIDACEGATGFTLLTGRGSGGARTGSLRRRGRCGARDGGGGRRRARAGGSAPAAGAGR